MSDTMSDAFEQSLADEYREKCRDITDALRFRNIVSEAEAVEYTPGGERNPATDSRAWIFYYAHCVRMCDRMQDAGIGQNAADNELLDDALLDSPEFVTLASGETVGAYPKSFHALRVIEACDRRITWLADKRVAMEGGESTVELDLVERVTAEIEHQYGMIAAAVTHDAPGLPFGDEDAVIGLPKWVQGLTTIDFAMIRGAFLRVNALRLALLVKMLSSSKADGETLQGRDTWSTFFANQEAEGRGPARHLMRDRSLVSQLAAALQVGESRKRAEAESKRKDRVA